MRSILFFVVPAIVMGILSAFIARNKRRDGLGFFVIGFILGPIGILWAALAGRESDTESDRTRITQPRKNSRRLD